MKEKEIQRPRFENYANLFSVQQDKDGNYFFNLHNNVIFEESPDPTTYELYYPSNGESWSSISNKFYNNVNYWWFICRFNNIIDVLKEPFEYKIIKIPNASFLNMIVNQINYKNV